MIGKLYQTRDRQVIQQWAKERHGQPALMRPSLNHTPGEIPCIVFPDVNYTESHTPISWEALFARLQQESLVFVYQNKTESGDCSKFCRFVRADVTDAIAAEEATQDREPLAEATGLYQTESLHSPLAKGVRIFRHPNLATRRSGGLIRLAIIAAILLAAVIVVVYWPTGPAAVG